MRRVLTVCISIALLAFAFPTRSLTITVYDPANHRQNILQALRALDQIRKQIDQLETMYENLERIEEPSWRDLREYMGYLNELAAQGEAVAYSLEGLFEEYRELFAGAVPLEEPAFVEVYEDWTSRTLDTLAATLDAVGAQAESYEETQGQLGELQALADGARGNLQALNVANMLQAHAGQEITKLNQLLAAGINAQNVYWGYVLTVEANREATQRWVLDNAEQPFADYGGSGGSTGVPRDWPYPCFGCTQ